MHKYTKVFLKYCKERFDFENTSEVDYGYQSMAICIIDCVYSLQARYYSSTIPVVERYAQHYLNNNILSSSDGVSALIKHITDTGGPDQFAKKILKNEQRSGGVLKAEVCLNLARYLSFLHIETVEDFRKFEEPKLLEIVIRGVKGIGNAGTNYLFMLAGDPDRCKPDTHIHHCVRDACGEDINDEGCQVLFTEVVKELKKEYPDMTVAKLDRIIWKEYQSKKNNCTV